jgi:hypothetical protein
MTHPLERWWKREELVTAESGVEVGRRSVFDRNLDGNFSKQWRTRTLHPECFLEEKLPIGFLNNTRAKRHGVRVAAS